MKKFFKVLVGVGALAGAAAGVIYLLNKKNPDDQGDFDDEDFEDIFAEDEEEDRDYVTLDIEKAGEKEKSSDETPEEETASKDADTVS